MEDATHLEKTKWRLNRLNKFKDWTMNTILKNLDAYIQDEAQIDYIKSELSPEMRNYVLEELLKNMRPKRIHTMVDFPIIVQAVFALINTRTEKLDLDVLMSNYPRNYNAVQEFLEVLKRASIAAPDVWQLKMNTYHTTVCLDSTEFQSACLGFLSSMKELTILELVGYLGYEMGFALLCRELPNLRVLSAPGTTFEETNMSQEDVRLSFGNLRLLHILSLSGKEREKISEVLPNLDILEFNLPNGLTLEDFLEEENLPRGRKYLNYETIISGSNVSADFSSIKYIQFLCDERKWDELKKTPKLPTTLEGLILIMLKSQDTFEAILLRFGANLRWLTIRGQEWQSVELNRISELCPMLEVLSLTSVQVTGSATEHADFSQLKELFTEDVDMINGSLTAVFSLLPNLRKLELKVRTCYMNDVQQVKKLIMEKKILSSLQSLHWGISNYVPGFVFKDVSTILKNASANLSELRKMKFSVDDIGISVETWSFRPNFSTLHNTMAADRNLFEILNLYK